MVAHERLIHDLRRARAESGGRTTRTRMGIERWHDSIFLRPSRCDASRSEWRGGRASKQACQVANGRQTNAPLTYIHSTKKREREQRKGPSYSTAQVPRDWWGGRGGGGKERCVRVRTRSGLGRGRRQMQCGRRRGGDAEA